MLNVKANNEVGELVNGLRLFLKNISVYVIKIRNVGLQGTEISADLEKRAEDISSSIDGIAQNVEIMSLKFDDLSKEIYQSDKAVSDIRDFTREVSKLINFQSSAVTDSSEVVNELISSIKNLAEISEEKHIQTNHLADMALKSEKNLQTTVNSIKSVSQYTNVIQEMVAVINEVAEQTALLAMNAAIEAVHAGEKGKGFAVVAAEIRTLAENARSNATDMSRNIKNIIDTMDKMSDNSNILGGSLHSMFEGISQINKSMEEMISKTEYMSKGSARITSTLGNLIDLTDNVKTSSTEMISRADQIDKAMGSITSLSDQNKENIEQISFQLESISGSTQMLFSLRISNKETIEILQKETKKYKTHGNVLADNVPPYNYLKFGQPSGFNIEVVSNVYKKLGLPCVVEFSYLDEALVALKNIPYGILLNVFRSSERESNYKWIGPLVKAGISFCYLFI